MGRGLLLLILVACQGAPVDPDPTALTAGEVDLLKQMWPLPAVPEDPTNRVADDPFAARLGQALYFDSRLSGAGEVSCATCHDPELGWADGLRLSETLGTTARHAPTVVNAGYNRWHFWDGRCDSQWCQALQPIENPVEMGGNRMQVVRLIVGDPAYREAWEIAFGPLPALPADRFPEAARPVPADPGHPHHQAWTAMHPDDRALVDELYSEAGKAIAAFQRQVVSRGSAFDAFAEDVLVEGRYDTDALSDAQRRGLKLFLGDGQCVACHAGPNFSNGEFHNVGLGPRPWLVEGDHGRLAGIPLVQEETFNGAGPWSDDPEAGAVKLEHLAPGFEADGQFKTPSLRDVALTGPYFHGGHAATLEEVVRHYADPTAEQPRYGHREDLLQQIALDDRQVGDLVAFLHALTGEPVDDELTEAPESPLHAP